MSPKFGLKTLSAALLIAFSIGDVSAAALGRITVLSTLQQPLVAEVEVTGVSPEEAASMIARLATPADYRQAGLEVSDTLQSMRFAVETKGGRSVIKISSSRSVNEPLVDLLLELKSVNGRIVREYNLLLDPPADAPALPTPLNTPVSNVGHAKLAVTPSVAEASSASVGLGTVSTAASSTPAKASVDNALPAKPAESAAHAPVEDGAKQLAPAKQASASASEKPALALPVASAPQNVPAAEPATTYRVKNGDSIYKIAGLLKAPSVTREQMMVALYNSNQAVFLNGNISRLRAGVTLQVPVADAALAVDRTQAYKIVMAKTKNFFEYQHRLAAQVAASAPVKEPASEGKAGTGEQKSSEQVKIPADNTIVQKDTLKLSRPKRGAARGLAIEDEIAHEKAMAESEGRVRQLEGYVKDLRTLVDLQNKVLSEKKR